MTTEGRFRLPYRPSLDGLRGVAILMVMAHHASLVQGGFLGVDVFFVLSGFLITALLMQEWDRTGSVNLRNFYARRALRLLPALLVLLSIFLMAPRLFGLGHVPWKQTLSVLFYSANWVLAFLLVNLGLLTPAWSLAIEEQFYILWPPLLRLLLILKVGRLWMLGLVLLGIASASVIRVLLWQSPPTAASVSRLYYSLDTRMDSLLLGCLLGLLTAWYMLPQRGWLLAATRYAAAPAAVIMLALAYRAPSYLSRSLYHGVELLVCVATAVVIVALLTSPPRLASLILEQRVLVWVGRISYGLYLWHVPIFYGVLSQGRMARLGITGVMLTLLRFAATFAVAAASFYLIEQPLLRLKEKFRGRAHA
jgi:peptidoglycan/LPS O-acetylase OafA/YrhL